jgi:hypothetical protein
MVSPGAKGAGGEGKKNREENKFSPRVEVCFVVLKHFQDRLRRLSVNAFFS